MAEWYGEDGPVSPTIKPDTTPRATTIFFQESIKPRILSFNEASRCLNTLGKDESGVRYAYLMLTAVEKKLTDISVITKFKHLLYLDLSGNCLNLDGIQPVCELPYLLYLKAERNVIESAALKSIPFLQVLILNQNQIAETNDIVQKMLETLELGENSLYTAQFQEDQMDELKSLSLHGNYLLDTSGTYPRNVENLCLNRNRIMKITPHICKLKHLKVLNLRDNFIRKLNGFTSELENLTYLNLRGNKIRKTRQFRKLQCLPKLDTLIVLENQLYRKEKENLVEEETAEEEENEEVDELSERDDDDEEKRIRLTLLVLLPNLKRINKVEVSDEERQESKEKAKQLTTEIFAEDSSEDEADVTMTTTDLTTEYLTEASLEMKGTPFDSTIKLDNFGMPLEEEGESIRKTSRNVDINLVPHEDG